MNNKILSGILIAIAFAFLARGAVIVSKIQSTLHENLDHQVSSVENIGAVVDWYGLTVVDSIVKYNFGAISKNQIDQILKEGKKQKDELLLKYYGSSYPEEQNQIKALKKYDAQVDSFLVEISQRDFSKPLTQENLKQLHSITEPPINLIEEILILKKQIAQKNAVKMQQEIVEFKKFIFFSFLLFVAIFIPFFFRKDLPKIEKYKVVENLKQIKKRAHKQKGLI